MSLKKYIVAQRGKRMYLISHNSTIVKQHLIRIEMEEILTQKKKTIRRRRKKKSRPQINLFVFGFFFKDISNIHEFEICKIALLYDMKIHSQTCRQYDVSLGYQNIFAYICYFYHYKISKVPKTRN